MKGIKKIINVVLVLSLVVGSILVTNSVETKAKVIGPGSDYMYNAPVYSFGDEIYGEFEDWYNDSYYKLYVPSDTYVKVYARSYDPCIHAHVAINDSDGDQIHYLWADSVKNWGYTQLEDVIYLRRGTYYIGVGRYGWADESDYLYVKLEKTTVKPKGKVTNQPKKSVRNTSSKFSVSKKRIVVKKGRKKKVTVTFKYNSGSVYYKIKNKRKVSASWGSWYGNKVKLTIKGKRKGSTRVVVTNSKTRKKYSIRVVVY